MQRLMNASKKIELASELKIANSFTSRLLGLLGKKEMAGSEALWIPQCSSIHTFFMKFPIDVVFVDSKLRVTQIYFNLPPWRITMPGFRSRSVFELKSGILSQQTIAKGDQLHVGH